MFENLDESNFILYAAKHYDVYQCHDTIEFYDDIKRFKYLKRLFGKYSETNELKERLILNHIIILYNVFGEHTTRMLFLKLKDHLPVLKPFLVLLGHLPEKIINIGCPPTTYNSSDIPMDNQVIEVLRKI